MNLFKCFKRKSKKRNADVSTSSTRKKKNEETGESGSEIYDEEEDGDDKAEISADRNIHVNNVSTRTNNHSVKYQAPAAPTPAATAKPKQEKVSLTRLGEQMTQIRDDFEQLSEQHEDLRAKHDELKEKVDNKDENIEKLEEVVCLLQATIMKLKQHAISEQYSRKDKLKYYNVPIRDPGERDTAGESCTDDGNGESYRRKNSTQMVSLL